MAGANGVMATAGSRSITAASLGPHLCALAALPVFMRLRYDQPLPAAASDGSTAPGSVAGLRLAVADTGPGIDAAQMDRLFQKFVQLDESSTRRHGSTGLGLALCADLTSLMEGEIQVRRAAGGGMEFVVLLPLKTGHADLTETPPHEPAARDLNDGAPLWVLAAEDHPTNRKVLELLLEPTGVHCRFVKNGQEAVEAWREQDWDVILMDVRCL